jgi:hypothetical protein
MTSSSSHSSEHSGSRDFVKNSSLYQEFLAEREEILKHKWLESERLGYDIGFERALVGLDSKTPRKLACPSSAQLALKGRMQQAGSDSKSAASDELVRSDRPQSRFVLPGVGIDLSVLDLGCSRIGTKKTELKLGFCISRSQIESLQAGRLT